MKNYFLSFCMRFAKYILSLETMKILRFIIGLAGRKPAYAPMLTQQATFLVMASDVLCRMVDTTDASRWRQCEKEIKACEVQGDALLSELHEQLYEDIVSAVTRSDIQTISMNIDEFMDGINYSAKSIMLYMPQRIDQPVRDLAQYISSEADAIRIMMPLLGELKKNSALIHVQCERITELEHAADDAYAEYIGEIFTNESNAIEVMKYKNIVEAFEAATDSAKKLSDNVRNILLRYM